MPFPARPAGGAACSLPECFAIAGDLPDGSGDRLGSWCLEHGMGVGRRAATLDGTGSRPSIKSCDRSPQSGGGLGACSRWSA